MRDQGDPGITETAGYLRQRGHNRRNRDTDGDHGADSPAERELCNDDKKEPATVL